MLLGAGCGDPEILGTTSALDSNCNSARDNDFYCTGPFPWAIIALDMDGDHVKDIVVSGVDTKLDVIAGLNRSRSRFSKLDSGAEFFSTSGQFATCDLDANNVEDLLYSDEYMTRARSWRVFQGGQLLPRDASSDKIFASTLDCLDINDDRFADVVGVSPSQELMVRLGNGDGTFRGIQPGGLSFVLPQGSRVKFADVVGDSHLDMFIVAGEEALVASGKEGGFNDPVEIDHSLARVTTALLSDMDGDSRIDLALVGRTESVGAGAVSIFLSSGSSAAGLKDERFIDVDEPFNDAAVLDLNGDTFADFVLGEFPGDQVLLLLSNGGIDDYGLKRFGLRATGQSLAATDFDADGLPEIAVTHPDLDGVGLYEVTLDTAMPP